MYWKKLLITIAIVCFSVLPIESNAGEIACGHGLGPCGNTPVQAINLFNSQTTSAVTTQVAVTIAALVGTRAHVYSVEARCNTGAATSGLTITDGGTTIWSTVGAEVGAAANFNRRWNPGLTGTTNSAVVITLAACTAGTGTIIVQADRW